MKTIDLKAATEVAGGYVPLWIVDYRDYQDDISNSPGYGSR